MQHGCLRHQEQLAEAAKNLQEELRHRMSALVLNLTLSLVLQSDQVSAGQRHTAPLARLHTDTRLKNKVCALQEHKNALWNPIFNTKCHNELWENLELQQETEEKAQLT